MVGILRREVPSDAPASDLLSFPPCCGAAITFGPVQNYNEAAVVVKRIQDVPVRERPREKLLQKGAQSLSDVELLAVLVGSGTKHANVLKVAERLLNVLDQDGSCITVDGLRAVEGVGPAKATLVVAALEFVRRRIRPRNMKISFPPDVYPLIRHIADRRREHFLCISLNGANEVIAVRTVSVGLVNRALVHPREVFADPITDRASAVIVAHNHPSGNLVPSQDDLAITRQLKEAGHTLGIKLLDHLIFNHEGYHSLLEKGQL
jgi:DNA repair protein RadC